MQAPTNRSDSYPFPPLVDEPSNIPLPELCERIDARITAFLAQKPGSERLKRVQEQTKVALGVIDSALDRYGLNALSLSYNGGKDCLVLLILYLCAIHRRQALSTLQPPNDANPTLLQTVYIQSSDPFREVEDFVASSCKTYHLSLVRYSSPMKAAFTEYLDQHTNIRAIFVGTRRTDPHGALLTHFDPTDHGWPSFMRIHPVIDWHYVQIWTFIRHLNIPYCPLYDQGYTSLGGTTDTHRNPALRRESRSESGRSMIEFRPAYELVDDDEERLGREHNHNQGSGNLDDAIADDSEIEK
ncbi:adenine nucleotide alpha hydrolases-like protein [Eremomyces bilateralis CBS 781.70]|uniref:FAD synthase n=1 Tax=Eremomyces bilateralis CBS 781.70 TaxID=1392243 RepID=A0A6G1GGP0_9PEZI|nr:adenine nucleotide alpha hydrolases-like protein [Eremomyces bilateralis CBS 781.70]KAF1817030.1 adenine nucleotide alpha hydrolases-like protein [Eremomyces bilateralis CBS 781.70]